MAFKSVQLIREYAEPIPFSKSMVPEQNVFYTTLLEIFAGIRWERVQAIPGTKPNSRDKVWIARYLQLFVKLDSGAWRATKTRPVVPFAEECASQVAKFLQWPEVPAAIVIHESQVNHPQYAFYKPWMLCFMNDGVARKCPVTFTFQVLVDGSVLPNKHPDWLSWKKTHPKISKVSYQRAYLFACLVGKGDACFCNTLHNSTTGTFYEIDNEVIGDPTYESNGVLHRFTYLKYTLISQSVLNSISSIDSRKFYDTLKSYHKKNENLNFLWQNEVYKPNDVYSKNFSANCVKIYQGAYSRLVAMQRVIKKWRGLTVRDMEKALENTWHPTASVLATYDYEKRRQEAFDDPIF